MNSCEKEKHYVYRLLVGGSEIARMIIKFMLMGFVNLSFYYYMCFVDFWTEGLALAYSP